jgi:hypothetical protein
MSDLYEDTVPAHIRAMISPSSQTIQATYGYVKSTAEAVSRSNEPIREALRLATGALDTITNPGEAGGTGLPIPLVMKAVSTAVNRVVEGRTGHSLQKWTERVTGYHDQLETFLMRLKQVAGFAEREDPSDGLPPDPAEFRRDEALLKDAQAQAEDWRATLRELSQLGILSDSILDVRKRAELREALTEQHKGSAEWARGLRTSLNRVGEAVREQVPISQTDLLELALTPLDDLREGLKGLKTQIDDVMDAMDAMDDLVVLALAQLRSVQGQLSMAETQTASRRIAATVLIPRLKSRLSAARDALQQQQSYLEKLDSGRAQGNISERVYQTLSVEYAQNCAAAQDRLALLEAETAAWKREGRSMLDAGVTWVEEEMVTTMVREMVQQLSREEANRRMAALKREMARFETAKELLATL